MCPSPFPQFLGIQGCVMPSLSWCLLFVVFLRAIHRQQFTDACFELLSNPLNDKNHVSLGLTLSWLWSPIAVWFLSYYGHIYDDPFNSGLKGELPFPLSMSVGEGHAKWLCQNNYKDENTIKLSLKTLNPEALMDNCRHLFHSEIFKYKIPPYCIEFLKTGLVRYKKITRMR